RLMAGAGAEASAIVIGPELLGSKAATPIRAALRSRDWNQPPKGIGPRCSAIGPSAATGRNKSAPTTAIVPSNRKPKVTVSSLIVPRVTGATFLRPSEKAMAIGGMIGREGGTNITSTGA